MLQNAEVMSALRLRTGTLTASNHHLGFVVSDKGRGFDSQAVKRGAGLTNMADRVDALGGRLEVASAPGTGTRIAGSVPVAAQF